MEQATTPSPVRLITGEPAPAPAPPAAPPEFPTSLALSLAAVLLAWGLCAIIVRHDRTRQPEEHALRALALRWRLPLGTTRVLRTLGAHAGVSPAALLLSPAALDAAWRSYGRLAPDHPDAHAAIERLRGIPVRP